MIKLKKDLKTIKFVGIVKNKMPLTKIGKEVLKKYRKRYGKYKGEDYFYATMKKNPDKTKKWHKK